MPKCNTCGNTETFVSFYRDITVEKYDGENQVDSWSISYEQTDDKPECEKCQHTDINWG